MASFGAIDLFAGQNPISGTNLWKTDKSPLNQIDEGVQDVIGKQARSLGGNIQQLFQELINSILGLPLQTPLGSPQDLYALFGDLLSMFGLSTGLGAGQPGGVGFNILTAVENFITNPLGLLQTSLLAPLVADAQQGLGLVGFVPLENLAIELLQAIIGGAQSVIDAILAALGIPAGVGNEQMLTTLFNQLFQMLGNPAFGSTFNPVTAVENFITSMITPTGLLATLENGFIPILNIPPLDTSKIVSGVFANSFVPGLQQIWSLVTGQTNATPTTLETWANNLLSMLGLPALALPGFNPAAAVQTFVTDMLMPTQMVAPLLSDASQTISGLTGYLPMQFIDTSLLSTLVGGGQEIIDAILGTVGIAPGGSPGQVGTYFSQLLQMLGSPALTSSTFNPVTEVENFITSMVAPTGLLAPLVGGFVPVLNIPPLDTSKIVSGVFANSFVPGLQQIWTSITGQSNATPSTLTTWANNLLSMLGLPPLASSGFNPSTAVQTFVTDMLMPTGMVAPLLSDASQTITGLTGYLPMQFLDTSLLSTVIGGGQQIIDAILGTVGIPPGGSPAQINTYFSQLLQMLGTPNLTSSTFNPVTEVQNFITEMIAPTGLLAPLVSGFVPVLNIPPLDTSKITSGVFANSFVPGLTQIANEIVSSQGGPSTGNTINNISTALQNILGSSIISVLAPGIIPPLDATIIQSGQFAQSHIPSLTSGWGGTIAAGVVSGALNAATIAGSAITSLINQANIPSLTSGWAGSIAGSLLTGTVAGSLIQGALSNATLAGSALTGNVAAGIVSGALSAATIAGGAVTGLLHAAQIPSLPAGWGQTIDGSLLVGNIAAGIISGVLGAAQIPSLPAGWGKTIDGSLLIGNITASLINGALSNASLAASALTSGAIPAGITMAGSALSSAISAANVPSLPAGWGKTVDGSLLVGSIVGSLVNGALSNASLAASALTSGAIPAGITIAGSALSSAITAANVPALPAGWGKTIDGSLLAGQVAGSLVNGALTAATLAASALTSGAIPAGVTMAGSALSSAITAANVPALPSGWGKTIDGSLLAGTIAGGLVNGALSSATLAASALTSGAIPAGVTIAGTALSSAITAANVPALPAGWGKTVDGSLLAGSVAAALISGVLGAAQIPSLPAGWGKTIDGSLLIGNIAASLVNGALANASLAASALTSGAIQSGVTIAGSALSSAITAANVPALPAGWGKTIDGSLLAGQVAGSLVNGALTAATLAASALTSGAIPAGVTIAGTALSSAISTANVPTLPAGWGKTIDGSLIIGAIAGSIINGALSNATILGSAITSPITPGNVPALDASKITSGVFSLPLIPPLDASQIQSGTLSQFLMPVVPVGSIGQTTPNLLANPTYATAAAIASNPDWTWDSTTTHTADGTGAAKAVCTGSAKTLLSDPSTPVAPGHALTCSHWLQWSGVTGSGACFQVAVYAYLGTNFVGSTVLQTISSPAASGAWQQLTGTYTVPASGVDNIRLAIQILTGATAGTTWWDDGSITKTQLLQQSWMTGSGGTLVNQLATMASGISAAALQTDLMSLVNNLGVGSFSNVAGSLSAITGRLQGLASNGMFSTSFIPKTLDPSWIPSGVWNIAQIPTSQLGISNIADIQTHTNNVLNALAPQGNTAVTGVTLPQAYSGMQTLYQNMVNNTQAIQAMQQNNTASAYSGNSISIDFANYPNGALSQAGFTVTYLPASGATSAVGISGGYAGWTTLNNDGNRAAFVIYNGGAGPPAATNTDYQLLRGSMNSTPSQATSGGQPYIYAVGRCDSYTNPQNYSFARGYCTGFLTYKADVGYCLGGVETIWASGIALTWSTSLSVVFGANGNPRQVQVFSGTQLVYQGNEPGTNSLIGAGYRYFGAKNTCTTSSGNMGTGGTLSGTSCGDNAPPTVLGSTFRASRLSTTAVTVSGGPAVLPANFFDTLNWISPDMTWSQANSAITITQEGTYMVKLGLYISNLPTGAKMDACLVHNGATVEALAGAFADNWSGNSPWCCAGSGTVYCRNGDTLQAAVQVSSNTSLLGEGSGQISCFSVALVNRSLA